MISAGKGHLSHQSGVVLARRRGSFADLEASGQRRRTRRERLPGQTGAIVPRGGVGRARRVPPPGREARREARRPRAHARDVPPAGLAPPLRRGVRGRRPGPGGHAAPRRHRRDARAGAGRDDPPRVPPPARGGSGRGCSPGSSPSRAGAASSCAVAPSSTPPSPGPPPRRGAGGARATRGPTRRGGATTGTSGTRRTRASTRGRASLAAGVTAASVSDVAVAPSPPRPDDGLCHAGAGHAGARGRQQAPGHPDPSEVTRGIARRRPGVPGRDHPEVSWERGTGSSPSRVRPRAGHPLHAVKDLFGPGRARRRGPGRNRDRLCVALALADLAPLAQAGGTLAPTCA